MASIKPQPKDRNMPTQHTATLLAATCCMRLATVLQHVGCCLTSFKLEPTTSNMSQHIATRWPNACNMLRPTMLRYVALACCDHLAGALHNLPNTDNIFTQETQRRRHVCTCIQETHFPLA